MGVESMTVASEAQIDPRIGRRVTWEIYGVRFVGTVKRVFNDPLDGEEYLSVTVERDNDRPSPYQGIPASIHPPGTLNKGNAQWVDG
jgi:hypothetical protein